MKYLLNSLICLLTSWTLLAQNAEINGIITDEVSGEALISATIKSGDAGTTTDIEGRFKLNLPPGQHQLEISYIGYQTKEQIVVLQAGDVRTINFTLSESATLLNTATVSSSKFEKSLGEVTVSLDVLKAEIINNTSATNVTEALQKVSGVNIVDGQANIRGGSGWSYGAGSRVLLLIDDIPALQADAGFPNWVDVPIENISNVEVVKGAASALYGSSAMNGIINIRTAYATSTPFTKFSTFATIYDQPKDEEISWWKEEGTFYRFDEEGSISDTLNFKPSFFGSEPGYNRPAKIGFSVAHRQKVGDTDIVLSAYGLNDESYREATYSKYGRFNLGIRHRINDRLSVGFNSNFNKGIGRSYFYWQNGVKGVYKASLGALSNSDRFRYTVDPFVTYFDKKGNRHKLLTRYYSINNKNDNGQANKSGLFYSEYQFQKQWESLDLSLTSGLVGTWSKVDAILYNGKYNSSNYAGYLQLDKKLFDRLNISAGVRYERNNLTNDAFIYQDSIEVYAANTETDAEPVYRLGLNYQPFEYTFFRASWGQGYRFPVLAEKFILTTAGGIDVIPNPELEPETGWSAEVGVKQGFKISNFNGYLDVAAFWSEYNNMMEFGLAGDNVFNKLFAFQSTNIGNTVIKGLEISTAGEGKFFGLPTTLLAGYTYIDPKFKDFTPEIQDRSTSEENVLKYRFRHSAKFDIESRYKFLSFGFSGTISSKMEAIDKILGIIAGINTYRAANDHGFKVYSARLSFIPNEHIRISTIVDNLFNAEYSTRPGLLDAPRSFTLKMDYTL